MSVRTSHESSADRPPEHRHGRGRVRTGRWSFTSRWSFVSFAVVLGLCLLLASSTALAETYDYDDAGRLIRVTYDDGSVLEYSYGPDGVERSITEGTGIPDEGDDADPVADGITDGVGEDGAPADGVAEESASGDGDGGCCSAVRSDRSQTSSPLGWLGLALATLLMIRRRRRL